MLASEGFMAINYIETAVWSVLGFLNHGLLNLSAWQCVFAALLFTHITIAAVTIYLHRHQAHRSLDLHWAPSHFFRLWLWMTTGMLTKEWVAIHRKHHAKCETPDDPHSPQTRGIKTVFWRGAEPWGILIGGEELHNNHHTYPTSAKLSVKWFEFDLGYAYIRLFSALGLANVKKTPPKVELGQIKLKPDALTLEALINHRYEVMAAYAQGLKAECAQDLKDLNVHLERKVRLAAKTWMHRDLERVPASVQTALMQARQAMPRVDTMLQMREELRLLWLSTNRSRDQLIVDLQAWCDRAESSGIAALKDFSTSLKMVRV